MKSVVALIVTAFMLSGCSGWQPYRYTLKKNTETYRSEPRIDRGECVVEVEEIQTQTYKVRHRFRTGADLYAGAFFLAAGWIYAVVAFAAPPDDVAPEDHRRGALTAAGVLTGVSLPFWGYFLYKRLDRPRRSQDVHEEIRTTVDLEASNACDDPAYQ